MMVGNGTLFELPDRVALVTGGNRGIGRAMALGLARAGASVVVLARNAEQNQELLAAGLRAIDTPDVWDKTMETRVNASFPLLHLLRNQWLRARVWAESSTLRPCIRFLNPLLKMPDIGGYFATIR